jgi:hypothetical protein
VVPSHVRQSVFDPHWYRRSNITTVSDAIRSLAFDDGRPIPVIGQLHEQLSVDRAATDPTLEQGSPRDPALASMHWAGPRPGIRVELPAPRLPRRTIGSVIRGRKSALHFGRGVTAQDMSTILAYTFGVNRSRGVNPKVGRNQFPYRWIPSQGGLNDIDCHLLCRSEPFGSGVYRYDPAAHSLVLESDSDPGPILEVVISQQEMRSAPISEIWTSDLMRPAPSGARGRDR